MNFYIITPSLNQLDYLKRCIASVRDQPGEGCLHGSRVSDEALNVKSVQTLDGSLNGKSTSTCDDLNGLNDREAICVHHHIQDGGSTDGTIEWLERYARGVEKQVSEDRDPNARCPVLSAYSFSCSSEKDDGMYDALNKGIDFALNSDNRDDSIVAWLNCDEQYLAGALADVADVFSKQPLLDLLCGSLLLIRPDGSLLARRQALPLRADWIQAAHLYNLSAGLFFRSSVWKRGIRFDTAYRNLGDEEWMLRLLSSEVRTACTQQLLAAFTLTGSNLSGQAGAAEEKLRLRRLYPVSGLSRMHLNLCRWAEKVRLGAYRRPALNYAVYTAENPTSRTAFHTRHAPFQWPKK